MDTIKASKIQITKSEFNNAVLEVIEPQIEMFNSKIYSLIATIKNSWQARCPVNIPVQKLYWYPDLNLLVPDFSKYKVKKIKYENFDEDNYFSEMLLFGEIQLELPTLSMLRKMKTTLTDNYAELDASILCVCDDGRSNYHDMLVAYNFVRNEISISNGVDCFVIPIVRLESDTSSEFFLRYIIPYSLCLECFEQDEIQLVQDINMLYRFSNQCIELWHGDLKYVGGARLIKEYADNPDNELFSKLHWELVDILKTIYSKKMLGDYKMETKEELLNCEKIRADIDPYEERLLTDLNRGHWDLWQYSDSEQFTVGVEGELYARNPIADINEDGVIAIDFGTKSTIVVYQSDVQKSLPMGIGDGNLSKEPTPKRYENPTVMHFVNLDQFLSDYNERIGRPKTKWEDLTISHTAMDQFANSKSEEYYEYLHQIKQWAGDRKRQFNIKTHTGSVYTLPAFLDVADEDWNPIELYAYYLGLYINNMRKGHGIFLDYYLSFPVTYETKIREKIIKSFEKGIKKSLPASIQQNEEIMSRFHINGDISEPAAYAVCALKEYGFKPKDEEEIFYGIFDFGGGTTDFDFGIWKKSPKRRYDYTIENFGADGDPYLGGENILEMLAFEVFKANQKIMREKGYTFTLAPKCTEFIGSDSILADSQEAEKNMHNLMKEIRPYWEKSDTQDVAEININKEIESDNEFTYKDIRRVLQYLRDAYPDEYASVSKYIASYVSKLNAGECTPSDIYDEIYQIMSGEGVEYEWSDVEEYTYDDEQDDEPEINDEIVFTLNLFDKEGKETVAEKLTFSQRQLDKLIEDRIREGVVNFFAALLHSYKNQRVKKPTKINILLAGNSCKSPVVKKVFDEEIEKQKEKFKELKPDAIIPDNLFEIFPPLGTDEAYDLMEKRGLNVVRDDFEKPTGKTGVAFGLIQCRVGGKIERIANIGVSDEIPFKYYIGWESDDIFEIFKDDTKSTKFFGKPDYNVWYKFIEADAPKFELLYTSLPECIKGELSVSGNAAVRRMKCDIVTDPDAFVYIRAIDPHTLEYVVAKTDDVENTMIGNIVRRELTDEK